MGISYLLFCFHLNIHYYELKPTVRVRLEQLTMCFDHFLHNKLPNHAVFEKHSKYVKPCNGQAMQYDPDSQMLRFAIFLMHGILRSEISSS